METLHRIRPHSGLIISLFRTLLRLPVRHAITECKDLQKLMGRVLKEGLEGLVLKDATGT